MIHRLRRRPLHFQRHQNLRFQVPSRLLSGQENDYRDQTGYLDRQVSFTRLGQGLYQFYYDPFRRESYHYFCVSSVFKQFFYCNDTQLCYFFTLTYIDYIEQQLSLNDTQMSHLDPHTREVCIVYVPNLLLVFVQIQSFNSQIFFTSTLERINRDLHQFHNLIFTKNEYSYFSPLPYLCVTSVLGQNGPLSLHTLRSLVCYLLITPFFRPY